MQKVKKDGEGPVEQARYPPDYEVISLGSDKSNYDPLVGEINYVDAKVPEFREEAKVEEHKAGSIQDSNSRRSIKNDSEPAAP